MQVNFRSSLYVQSKHLLSCWTLKIRLAMAVLDCHFLAEISLENRPYSAPICLLAQVPQPHQPRRQSWRQQARALRGGKSTRRGLERGQGGEGVHRAQNMGGSILGPSRRGFSCCQTAQQVFQAEGQKRRGGAKASEGQSRCPGAAARHPRGRH